MMDHAGGGMGWMMGGMSLLWLLILVLLVLSIAALVKYLASGRRPHGPTRPPEH